MLNYNSTQSTTNGVVTKGKTVKIQRQFNDIARESLKNNPI